MLITVPQVIALSEAGASKRISNIKLIRAMISGCTAFARLEKFRFVLNLLLMRLFCCESGFIDEI